jgi:methyl-accepting chemotaxis protein-2 (aspartate sensor receptor)
VLFIGIDISKNLAMLKEKIKAIKDRRDRLRLRGERRRQEPWQCTGAPEHGRQESARQKASDGRLFIKEMLDTKEGSMNYDWAEREGSTAREDGGLPHLQAVELAARRRHLHRRDHPRGGQLRNRYACSA